MRIALLIALLAAPGASARAADVEARWLAVDVDVEGAPETISHYLLYCGRAPRPPSIYHPADGTFRYERVINVGAEPRFGLKNLEAGHRWYFAVAAVDKEGNLSDYSAEVSLAIPDAEGKRSLPPAPAASTAPAQPSASQPPPPNDGCVTVGESRAAVWLLPASLFFRRRKR